MESSLVNSTLFHDENFCLVVVEGESVIGALTFMFCCSFREIVCTEQIDIFFRAKQGDVMCASEEEG